MENGTILIVDDNKSVLASLELLLENEFGTVRTAANPNQITTLLTTTSIDVVILDMNFSAGINNGNEGLYWLKQIHEIRPSLPVVMLTAYGDVELAVKALKNGATDFLLKPWDNQILIRKIKEAYKSNNSKAKSASKATGKQGDTEKPSKPEMLVGHSPAMLQLIKVVTKVAKTDANILITGENGTGKEMLAREIHRLSPRNSRQMLGIDMGAISESLFESELFGHERGAFTDAYESRPGKFEAANGSSLFMDEIGNLSIALQAKLLTVLQNRNVTRIGSNKAIPVDIRLISATNKDIPEMVKQGLFREDLFYRLKEYTITVPPLRDCQEDILSLAEFFRETANKELGRNIKGFTVTARNALLTYPWPGNVRELKQTIQTAVLQAQNDTITVDDLEIGSEQTTFPTSFTLRNDEEDKERILRALKQAKGNKKLAAKMLGIGRSTLYNKLDEYGLNEEN